MPIYEKKSKKEKKEALKVVTTTKLYQGLNPSKAAIIGKAEEEKQQVEKQQPLKVVTTTAKKPVPKEKKFFQTRDLPSDLPGYHRNRRK